MLRNFLISQGADAPLERRWWLALVLPLWVVASFVLAQLILAAVYYLVLSAGVVLDGINSSVVNTFIAACVYILTLVIVLGVPWLIKKKRTTLNDLGLQGLPTWSDIGLAPIGFILYLLASAIVVYVFGMIVPSFDASQTQNVGFENLSQQYEYVLAFITLVIIAPIAEETLFRGYLFSKLRRAVPLWVAMLVTSVLFGAVHGQWNVGIDVFVLSMVACGLREVTGSIWAGILLHMIKNGLAFYILFINTSFLIQ